MEELARTVRVDDARHRPIVRVSAREECKSAHIGALVKINELESD